MTEAVPSPIAETPAPAAPEIKAANPDKYKTLVVVLTILTTVITAIIAGLQADANIRTSIANRDSQLDAILASGELHRQGLEWAYEMNVLSSYLRDAQESNIMQLTALQQATDGSDSSAGEASMRQGLIAQARASTAQKFSIFFTDPRYAASGADGLPNMEAYLTDSVKKANDLVAQQNAAADAYNKWNGKSDAYTSVLAVLAVAFFLLGLAQALAPRVRILLAIFGMAAMLAAVLWTIIILVG